MKYIWTIIGILTLSLTLSSCGDKDPSHEKEPRVVKNQAPTARGKTLDPINVAQTDNQEVALTEDKEFSEEENQALLSLIEQAKSTNDANVQHQVGLTYYTNQNYEEALKWFKQSADQKHAESQYQLGLMYIKGQGIDQNNGKAYSWFKKSADQKHAESQYQLGHMFLEGRVGLGLNKHTRALTWFTRAATQKHAPSQYQAGLMHLNGEGRKANKERGYDLIKKSAAQGHKEAQEILDNRPQVSPTTVG